MASREEGSEIRGKDEACCFAFAADCRRRGVGYTIPPGYFGNCLAFCYAEVKKSEILGENGMVMAMKAIGKRVGEVENEALKSTGDAWSVWKKFVESGGALAVAGSPRLGAYDLDFGWGRPVKTEVVHIDSGKLFSIGESRDEKGGIEVGLVLTSPHMARFVVAWERNLKEIQQPIQ